MRRILTFFCLTTALVFVSLSARAEVMDQSTPSYSGVFMFVYQGNDNGAGQTAMLGMINDWFRDNKGFEGDYLSVLRFVDKYSDSPSERGVVDLSFTSPKGGTWTSTVPIEFYAVKGGNFVAMYWLEDGADSGFWSTEHIRNGGGNIPDLSHLSVFNPLLITRNVPTPEPASLLLVGGGLIALAFLRRNARRRSDPA